MNEIVIKETKGKSIGLSLLGIIMVLNGIFVLYIGIRKMIIWYLVVGLVAIIFFGYALTYILIRTYKVLREKDDMFLFKINDQGITDCGSKVGVGLIKWEDIKSVKLGRMFTEKFVSIELLDEEAFFSKLPKGIQKFQKVNRRMGFAPINLSMQTAKITPEEVVEVIQIRLDTYL
ncbi:MAG TPA: hypothetical protein GX707_11580 [Epulopiscium sp.]|nr:hypothetical protein [Candidatus Epulonipiscium sp.]